MARSVSSTSWQRGFAESTPTPSWADESKYISENGERAHYAVPNPREKATSTVANEFGFTSLRSWPGVYNGTEGLQTNPPWWKPSSEVDVLICGGESEHTDVELLLTIFQLVHLVWPWL